MKIARQYYWGSPCVQLCSRKGIHADLDVNTRRPGMSLWMGTNVLGGPHRRRDFSFCLDVNAPLGEPHRLELNLLGYHIGIGLWPGHGYAQTWDRKRSEWVLRDSLLVIHPLDHRQRWDAAHPDESTRRAAWLRATGGRWGGG
jgi:hypothetical protein